MRGLSERHRARAARMAAIRAAEDPMRYDFTPDEAAALQARIYGKVLLPIDADYPKARMAFSNMFQRWPQLVVECETPGDVVEALAFARRHQLPFVCRSGGHSTAGYSTCEGMILDVRGLDDVVMSADLTTVTCGAGTPFHKLNDVLETFGRHVPGGGCSDVCVGGYLQGGGYGLTSMMFGLNCDNVVSMLVALADGRIVRADATTNADLFWAVRGGTGNNFGVLLEVTYRTHELGLLWGFELQWRLDDAAQALTRIIDGFTGPAVPRKLGFELLFLTIDDAKMLSMRGIVEGDEDLGRSILGPLLRTTGVTVAQSGMGRYAELNSGFFDPVPVVPPTVCTLTDSRFVGVVEEREWDKVIEYVRRCPDPATLLALEPYGGAITSVGRYDNALIHRDARANVFTWVFWLQPHDTVGLAYLDEFARVLDPLSIGEAFQNYPNPRYDRAAAAELFWKDAYPTLRVVKRKYDPEHCFRFPQGIEPWDSPMPPEHLYVDTSGPIVSVTGAVTDGE